MAEGACTKLPAWLQQACRMLTRQKCAHGDALAATPNGTAAQGDVKRRVSEEARRLEKVSTKRDAMQRREAQLANCRNVLGRAIPL